MALSPALMKAMGQAQNKFSRSSSNRIKPKEGKNTYRILAPVGAKWLGPNGEYWAELGVHWIKADANGKPLAVVGCSSIVHGLPCPIDTAIDLAINHATDEESKKLYEDWKARTSILINVLDRSKTSGQDEPEILEITGTTFAKLTELTVQHAEEGVDITDLDEGLDVVITRSGKGLQTEYTVLPKPGKSPVVKPESLAKCHDLKAHIEKEFFRGEEGKALNIIAQISGVKIPSSLAIGSAAGSGNLALTAAKAVSTPTPALASAAVSVEEEESALEELETAPAAEEAAPFVEDDEEAKLEAQLAAARAKKAAAAAAKPAAPKAAPAPAPATEVLSSADVDDVLAELNEI